MARWNDVDDLPAQHRAEAAAQLAADTPKAKRQGAPVPLEHEEQADVFRWADSHPVAHLLFAIPNGQYRDGQRMEVGLKSGVPDMFLPVARCGLHGLFIELKRRKGGVVSKTQREWMDALAAQGYGVALAYGAGETKIAIEAYLEGGKE